MRLIDIGLPQSKNKVNSNSKARIDSFYRLQACDQGIPSAIIQTKHAT